MVAVTRIEPPCKHFKSAVSYTALTSNSHIPLENVRQHKAQAGLAHLSLPNAICSYLIHNNYYHLQQNIVPLFSRKPPLPPPPPPPPPPPHPPPPTNLTYQDTSIHPSIPQPLHSPTITNPDSYTQPSPITTHPSATNHSQNTHSRPRHHQHPCTYGPKDQNPHHPCLPFPALALALPTPIPLPVIKRGLAMR